MRKKLRTPHPKCPYLHERATPEGFQPEFRMGVEFQMFCPLQAYKTRCSLPAARLRSGVNMYCQFKLPETHLVLAKLQNVSLESKDRWGTGQHVSIWVKGYKGYFRLKKDWELYERQRHGYGRWKPDCSNIEWLDELLNIRGQDETGD